MRRFTTVTGIAAPLPEADIDTDVIFPARFLLIAEKDGLGKYAFNERRAGKANGAPDFILDVAPFDEASILVAGHNFGSGSSREQAVWALADFGFRCIIAPSFGEIFFNNCLKNGVLPVVLDEAEHRRALAAAQSARPLTVDLEARSLTLPDGGTIPFATDPFSRRALLQGLDEIGMILSEDLAEIDAFEARQRRQEPWLDIGDWRLAAFAAETGGA